MKDGKIFNIQALRGVAALLVLVCHVADMEAKYGVNGGFLPNFENEGSSGIYLFFVISGFIMVTISSGLHQAPGAFRDFLYRRATRIYPFYWIISLLILGVWIAKPAWVNSSMGGRVDVLSSFLLLPQDVLPLLGQGWSLEHEVYFYLVFAFSLFLPRRVLPWFLGGWAAVVLTALFLFPGIHTSGSATLHLVFSALTLQFIAGAASAWCIARTGLKTGACLFVVGCVSLGTFLASTPLEGPKHWQVMYLTLPVLAMMHGAVALERCGRILLPRFLQSVGDASYSLYLTHILAISAIGRVWKSMGWISPWTNWLLIAFMITGAVAAGFSCYYLIERPLLRLAHGRFSRKEQPRVEKADLPAPADQPVASPGK